MTMPHLMNCEHTPNGWCLSCVGKQHAEIERLRGIVPEVLEQLNDELCAENERLRAEIRRYTPPPPWMGCVA